MNNPHVNKRALDSMLPLCLLSLTLLRQVSSAPCQRCFSQQATNIDLLTLSWESCAEACNDQSFSYAAVQNGNECLCSNNNVNGCPQIDGMCYDTVCPGDENGVEVSFVFLLLVRCSPDSTQKAALSLETPCTELWGRRIHDGVRIYLW